jgi:3-isopropylmalate/(R)-2-methylmalate dehydratase small subunit
MDNIFHQGIVVPLDGANIDTDQIIPKQFLTAVSRKGFGKHLFHDWRYLDGDIHQPDPNFVMNKPEYQEASILLTRQNFGCGSSREHAPWALLDFGIQVIIASSFADIFYGNCLSNQILPIVLQENEIESIFNLTHKLEQLSLTIDLPNQQVICGDILYEFQLDSKQKHNLLHGLDAIGLTLQNEDEITAFEQKLPVWKI